MRRNGTASPARLDWDALVEGDASKLPPHLAGLYDRSAVEDPVNAAIAAALAKEERGP
jgi:hypothetical protein